MGQHASAALLFHRALDAAANHTPRGWAVQVDPIKPTLKPPGIKRLKLKRGELLSSFAFKSILRRFTEVSKLPRRRSESSHEIGARISCTPPAGAYTRPLFIST
jgi:hypothetical protein